MIGLRATLAVLLLAALAPGSLSAQDARPAVVVQIAGANLYLDVGTDAGVRTGDTLTVRRSPAAAPVGLVLVVAATSARSVIAFVGTPFPATRGDTLHITPGRAIAVPVSPVSPVSPVAPVAPVVAAVPRPRYASRMSAATGRRVDGAVGLEMWGSHSETVGLGSDPVRTTQDVGMPAVRFRTQVSDANSFLIVNVRAQQRIGPQNLFDRATRLRIYEARYDRTAGALRLSVGRFFSDFDHASGFWDGASLRVGDNRGVFGGVAAGFEPQRGNEEFSADVPKVAAFVGTRTSTERLDFAGDLAVHQTLQKDDTQRRSVGDLSLRLRAGRFGLSQEIEVSPPTPLGTWGISRYILRASAPMGDRVDWYGSAVSDRMLRPLMDTTILVLPIDRRERLTTGLSYQGGNGFYLDINGSINGPRDSTSGYSAGAMLSFPDLIGTGGLAVNGSYFTSENSKGITASPSMEYRFGRTRLRAGYQFFKVDGANYAVTTHGADLRISQAVTPRVYWFVQATGRTGRNLSATTIYSSFEVRF